MKIIEAMKKVKANREKVEDLLEKIKQNSAHLSHENPMYPDPKAKIIEWKQSVHDTNQETVKLLTRIAKTNLETNVTMELGGKNVTKSIAEWIWRRREFAGLDHKAYMAMTNRGLKGGLFQNSTGNHTEVQVILNFDPNDRDIKAELFRTEPSIIDSTLEVVNATTDLKE